PPPYAPSGPPPALCSSQCSPPSTPANSSKKPITENGQLIFDNSPSTRRKSSGFQSNLAFGIAGGLIGKPIRFECRTLSRDSLAILCVLCVFASLRETQFASLKVDLHFV